MGLVASDTLRSTVVRKGTAATLPIAQGFQSTLVASGSFPHAVIMREGSINVGHLAVGRFGGLELGRQVKFGAFQSEVWGDVNLIMPAFQRADYQSVSVKLTDESSIDSEVAFKYRITPVLLAGGLAFAALTGSAGGLLPALRAARIPVARALREI